ncbi:MAG: cupredoxin domain-containing protein [Sporichthyaceae bacterium]
MTTRQVSRRGLLRGAVGFAAGAVLTGCGAAADPPVAVEVPSVPQSPVSPLPTQSVTPFPRTVSTPSPVVTLTIRDGDFGPEVLRVAPGTTIRLVNVGSAEHSLAPAEFEEHNIRSGDVPPGNARHVTAPDTPGEYRFVCADHPGVAGETGSIVVTTDPAALAGVETAAPEASGPPEFSATVSPSPSPTAGGGAHP